MKLVPGDHWQVHDVDLELYRVVVDDHDYTRVRFTTPEGQAKIHIGAFTVEQEPDLIRVHWSRIYRSRSSDPGWVRFKALVFLAALSRDHSADAPVLLDCDYPGSIDGVLAELSEILSHQNGILPGGCHQVLLAEALHMLPSLMRRGKITMLSRETRRIQFQDRSV